MLCFFMEKVVHIYVYMYGIPIPNLLTAQNKKNRKKIGIFIFIDSLFIFIDSLYILSL